MVDMPNVNEFCTCNLHLEGEEVFNSTKQKIDLSLNAEEELYRLDKVNFLHPCSLERVIQAHVVCMLVIDEEQDPNIHEVVLSEPTI